MFIIYIYRHLITLVFENNEWKEFINKHYIFLSMKIKMNDLISLTQKKNGKRLII